MSRLFVIGNGFDLHFHLKTLPENFMDYLSKKRIYNEMGDALDIFEAYGVNWKEYEQSLGDMNLEEIEVAHGAMPDYLSDHESDRDGVIWEMNSYLSSLTDAICSALSNMVIVANEQLDNVEISQKDRDLFCFRPGDMILSFNYTSTIERLFSPSKEIPILHIHGLLENGERLIFGHNGENKKYREQVENPNEDGDYYWYKEQEAIYDFFLSWRKKYKFSELKNFLSMAKDITEVMVLGHGMGEIDSQYMEIIEETLRPKCWKISYYDDSDLNSKQNAKYSFSSKVEFFKF